MKLPNLTLHVYCNITDLEEYREYSVAVSALTDPGPGSFSSPQSATTLEDGKLNFILSSMILSNFNS